MKKFVIAMITLLAVLFVISRFTEMQGLIEVIQTGNLWIIALGILAQMVWFLNVNTSYRSIYNTMGIQERPVDLFRLTTAANFITILTPSGGMTALAVFLANGRRRGHPSGRVTLASILYVLFDYVGLLTVVLLSLVVLFRRQNLHWTEITATILLILFSLILTLLLVLGWKLPLQLSAILAWFARQINKIYHLFSKKKTLVPQEKALALADDIVGGMIIVKTDIKSLWRPILLALTNRALLIWILALTFLAFQIPFSIGTVVAGYGISYLFAIISPTPSGIGVVEGVLTVSLHSLNVPLEQAAIITMVYRGITFWVPFLIGGINFQRISRINEKADQSLEAVEKKTGS